MGTGVFVLIADRSEVPRTLPPTEQVLYEDLLAWSHPEPYVPSPRHQRSGLQVLHQLPLTSAFALSSLLSAPLTSLFLRV